MCGRYWIDPDADGELGEIIAQMQRLDNPPKTSGEIFPGDRAPVICRSRSGAIRPFAMEWGFRMEDGRRIINARSETAGEKPLFRESMGNRRCLLPMSAYFEWETRGRDKIKYRIAPRRGFCCLAGLYRFEADGPVFTVLTRDAAPDIRFIHDRMPVLLSRSAGEDFLLGDGLGGIESLYFEEAQDAPRQLRFEEI